MTPPTPTSPIHILLLGANGRTGREILAQALAAGDRVTALVRSPDKLADLAHERLSVEVGDACDPRSLAPLLPGHDVVISTLGPRWPSKAACAVYPQSGAAIVEALAGSEVRRLLVTSSALLFPTEAFAPRALRFLVPNIVDGASKMEQRICASELDWTIARTDFLNDTKATDYRLGEDELPPGGGAVPRAAVASFLLREARQGQHKRRVVGLCG